MALISWSEYEEPTSRPMPLDPGRYLVEVTGAEERVSSKSGSTYFSLALTAPAFGQILTFDIVMLEGKATNIGLCKLKRLGVPCEGTIDLLPAELIGRRAYVQVVEEEYKGEVRLKVELTSDDDGACGYWALDAPPPGVIGAAEEDSPPPPAPPVPPAAADSGTSSNLRVPGGRAANYPLDVDEVPF